MGDELPAVQLGSLRHAVAVASTDTKSCSVLDNYDVKCWGLIQFYYETYYYYVGDEKDEMGNYLSALEIFPTTITTTTVELYACLGAEHTCVVMGPLGEVKCFGKNDFGQLGYGDTTPRG
eukprot:4999904-Amphidinium_carterae.1